MLEAKIADALRIWSEIPTKEIPFAVDEAIIQAGAFPATTGLVAQAYRKPQTRELELNSGCKVDYNEFQKMMEEADKNKASEEEQKKFLQKMPMNKKDTEKFLEEFFKDLNF